MELNRKLIKTQAKELINTKVFSLFIITAVVMLLAAGMMEIKSSIDSISELADKISSYRNGQFDDFGDFDDSYGNFFDFDDDYGYSDEDNPLDNFDGKISTTAVNTARNSAATNYIKTQILKAISTLVVAITLVFCPLMVLLDGYYVQFIRTAGEVKAGKDLSSIFKGTFDKNYGKRLGLQILRNLFISLWCILLFFPGIIYYYSTYFANELMADNPNLSPMEALKLSKKMIQGHRTELFVMDLSFILWWLLMACTCGLASIYVLPYYKTTRALYYQNFRTRSLSIGETVEDDYLSQAELYQKYAAAHGFGGQYYQPQQGAQRPYYSGAYPPPYGNPANGASNSYQQNTNYTAYGTQQPFYQTPPQQTGNQTPYYNQPAETQPPVTPAEETEKPSPVPASEEKSVQSEQPITNTAQDTIDQLGEEFKEDYHPTEFNSADE